MKKKKNRRENLISNLRSEILAQVGPSPIHGVGVFAIKDIPKGTELFKTSNAPRKDHDDIIELSEEDLSKLDEETVSVIKSYFVKSHLGTYTLPEQGPNDLFWGYFINHSSTSNLDHAMGEGGKDGFVHFVSNRDIEKGEELTQDYSRMSQNQIFLMEQFKFLERRAILSGANFTGE